MRAPIDVSIIIVNWNSREFLRRCLASINLCCSNPLCEIIVVDSGSFDGSDRLVQDSFPQVRFVQSFANIGFGRANMLGAGQAGGDALLFLNPDTEITEGVIASMYQCLRERTDAGAIGCRLLNTDGSLQMSCVQRLPTILNQVLSVDILQRWFPKAPLFGTKPLFDDTSGSVAEVEAVSGACVMVRRDVFFSVGGFSPEYFMYGEDMDLCFKLRRQGRRNYHVSDYHVTHHGGGSSRQAVSRFAAVMTVDSVNQFLFKSHGRVYCLGYRCAMVVMAALRLIALCVIAPAAPLWGGYSRWNAIARKWIAIGRWGIGIERWTTGFNRGS